MYGSRRTCEVTLIGTNRPTSGTVMPTPTRCAGAWTCAERGTAERTTAQATATGFVCMGPPSGRTSSARQGTTQRLPYSTVLGLTDRASAAAPRLVRHKWNSTLTGGRRQLQ